MSDDCLDAMEQIANERVAEKEKENAALRAEVERLNAELATGKYRTFTNCGCCSNAGTLLLGRAEDAEAKHAGLSKAVDNWFDDSEYDAEIDLYVFRSPYDSLCAELEQSAADALLAAYTEANPDAN